VDIGFENSGYFYLETHKFYLPPCTLKLALWPLSGIIYHIAGVVLFKTAILDPRLAYIKQHMEAVRVAGYRMFIFGLRGS